MMRMQSFQRSKRVYLMDALARNCDLDIKFDNSCDYFNFPLQMLENQ